MIGPKSISNSSNNNDNNGNSINDNDNNDIFSQQNSITNFACRHVRTLVPSFSSSSLPSSSSSISADRCRRCHFWGRLTSRQESFLLSNPERIELKKNDFFYRRWWFLQTLRKWIDVGGWRRRRRHCCRTNWQKIEQYKIRNSSQSLFVLSQ